MSDTQQVYLPAVLSDEFGVSRTQARESLLMGTIEIDGEPWTGSKLEVPLSAIDGKELVVIGPDRHFKMDFDAARRNSFLR